MNITIIWTSATQYTSGDFEKIVITKTYTVISKWEHFSDTYSVLYNLYLRQIRSVVEKLSQKGIAKSLPLWSSSSLKERKKNPKAATAEGMKIAAFLKRSRKNPLDRRVEWARISPNVK